MATPLPEPNLAEDVEDIPASSSENVATSSAPNSGAVAIAVAQESSVTRRRRETDMVEWLRLAEA
jgi:hypothetical protein